jgi:hypothetical protein
MNQALYAHMNNKRKRKRKDISQWQARQKQLKLDNFRYRNV